jgi:hypothetical protein
VNTLRPTQTAFCEIFKNLHRPIHGIALEPQSLHHPVDFEHSTRTINDRRIARFRPVL